jgi:SAM-dependent methyltransferase
MMPASMVSASEEYDAFAPYYDDFTAGSDYEAWTRNVLELTRGLGFGGTTLLDLACGTGKSFVPFLRRGFRVTGCDVSEAMLAEAARKAPDATLVRADLRELGTIARFDVVTCFDDSLNYLQSERDLALALRAIASNLAPGGVALFDLNTLQAYRTTFARDSVIDRDGTIFVWRGESTADAARGSTAAATIDIFSPRDGALYERIRTRHLQRHFGPECVTKLLAGAGLDCLGVHGACADGGLEAELDETRHLKALYVARPSKGGDAQ